MTWDSLKETSFMNHLRNSSFQPVFPMMAIFLAPVLIFHVLHLIPENCFLLLQFSTINFLCQSRNRETRGIHIRRKSSVRKKEVLQSLEEEWYLGRRKTAGEQRRWKGEWATWSYWHRRAAVMIVLLVKCCAGPWARPTQLEGELKFSSLFTSA